MVEKKESKNTLMRKKFELQKTWTLDDLFNEFKTLYPDIDEKKLKHRIRSEINNLRQRNIIHRVSPSTWQKL